MTLAVIFGASFGASFGTSLGTFWWVLEGVLTAVLAGVLAEVLQSIKFLGRILLQKREFNLISFWQHQAFRKIQLTFVLCIKCPST
jgi:hypothetical protein